ncbi:hypothetical protein GUJ93_ZPchr0004g38904 [Zizania palustris]|uniref:Uncharacterized protein n=1 Tax=Zizania palustris TaxID=103762 RepID=A0A8J5SAA1_ZIZPA|nr:hypothetical protein GUJ93_ZPchr0004g38904 [Zizania palustris]
MAAADWCLDVGVRPSSPSSRRRTAMVVAPRVEFSSTCVGGGVDKDWRRRVLRGRARRTTASRPAGDVVGGIGQNVTLPRMVIREQVSWYE